MITFVAVALGRGAADPPSWWSVLLFALGALTASAAWQLVLVGGGTVLGRLFRGRRTQLTIAVSAAIMLTLALTLLLPHAAP